MKIGAAAKSIRESHGLNQKQAADALQITQVHLCNIEKDKATASPSLIEKYRELWGVDVYVLAWCQSGDVQKLPPKIRDTAEKLRALWSEELVRFVQGTEVNHAKATRPTAPR